MYHLNYDEDVDASISLCSEICIKRKTFGSDQLHTTLGNPFNPPMKWFCSYSQCSHLNVLTFFPPDWVDYQIFFKLLRYF